ncbi:MAG TPA: hypothetical protein VGQ99_21250, partial [Tepidisphaeraceae bacterium]|nr:hypothetical protein [Tepidisphaeraceae bacterium]
AGPAVAYQFRRTDVCVICGLSGSPPDDEELRDYFKELRARTKVVHFGVGNDATCHLAKILKALDLDYHYRDVKELGELPWLLNPPRYSLGGCDVWRLS